MDSFEGGSVADVDEGGVLFVRRVVSTCTKDMGRLAGMVDWWFQLPFATL